MPTKQSAFGFPTCTGAQENHERLLPMLTQLLSSTCMYFDKISSEITLWVTVMIAMHMKPTNCGRARPVHSKVAITAPAQANVRKQRMALIALKTPVMSKCNMSCSTKLAKKFRHFAILTSGTTAKLHWTTICHFEMSARNKGPMLSDWHTLCFVKQIMRSRQYMPARGQFKQIEVLLPWLLCLWTIVWWAHRQSLTCFWGTLTCIYCLGIEILRHVFIHLVSISIEQV